MDPPSRNFSFIVECVSDFGPVGRKKEKKRKKKGGMGLELKARYLSIISVDPDNNQVWLRSQQRCNGISKNRFRCSKSNEDREKTKNL